MKLHVKVPPPPSLPRGLIALVRTRLPDASTAARAEQPAAPEPVEATRAWKPDRALLQPNPKPTGESDFAHAADELTLVGAINLNDPSLLRSQPPPAPSQDASVEGVEDEDTTIEFVGSLDPDREEAQPTTASVWGEEKTRLYRPQRARLVPEEPSNEFEPVEASPEATLLDPGPPKVVLNAAVLADATPDPARAEATKKKRRGRQNTDTRLGLFMCLLGGLALALSAAWRHPRTAPVTHDAFARVAAVAASLLSR